MFKAISKFIAKHALPQIIANLVLDVDTVEKTDGFYLRIRVEVFDFKLLDEHIKLSSQTTESIQGKDVLTLDSPIDVVRANQGSFSNRLLDIGQGGG